MATRDESELRKDKNDAGPVGRVDSPGTDVSDAECDRTKVSRRATRILQVCCNKQFQPYSICGHS